RIASLTSQFKITVIVDELYSRLIYDNVRYTHLAALPGLFERTVTLLGPSKTESMSGYRLGVVVAPSAIVDYMENVLSITALRAPAYAQHVLVPWLRDDREWLVARLSEFNSLRDMTIKQLRRLPWLKLHPQMGTAYAWADVSALGLPGPKVAEAILTEASVLVSPGYQFGPNNEGCFRVCYARDESQWQQALEKMTFVLDKLAVARNLPERRK
ncbi:MAG: pyridoxal phosphate-dependent aminotransferase, partial [Candidatus Saccharimonadales bacterium]